MSGSAGRLGVVTVCRDNERTIGSVLESVRTLLGDVVGDNALLAYDSGSVDGTIGVCRAFGARVIEGAWLGHVATKQLVLEKAAAEMDADWLLHLDSDEPVTEELAASTRALVTGGDAGVVGARVRRVVWYRGRALQHAWQPEWRLRLVRRSAVVDGSATWVGRDPHDRLEVASGGGVRVVDLDGVLRHDSFVTFAEHFAKQAAHAQVAAEAMVEEGRRPSYWRLMTSPVGAFLKQMVLKRAFLDGYPGWLAAATTAAGALMKHACHIERYRRGDG